VRILTIGLAGLILLAGCGFQRGNSDHARDADLIASAIRAADDSGQNFSMDEKLVLNGGDIPSGQSREFKGTATGAVRSGHARWTYKVQQQRGSVSYEMLLGHGQIYVRPAGSQAWRTTPAQNLSPLYPSIRLDQLRATVLLAKDVSGWTLAHVNQGFAHKYVVKPATEQLVQIENVPLAPGLEQTFLKTAKVEVDVFLSASGDRLYQIEVHIHGTDPDSREVQQIDCVAHFKGGKVGPIGLPMAAQPVQPQDILGSG
jgi:hypothetical protein